MIIKKQIPFTVILTNIPCAGGGGQVRIFFSPHKCQTTERASQIIQKLFHVVRVIISLV